MSIFKRKEKNPEIVLSSELQSEIIKSLIKKQQEELIAAKIQCWIFEDEAVNHKHISKEKAMESLGLYQSRCRYMEENILAIESYARQHNIEI